MISLGNIGQQFKENEHLMNQNNPECNERFKKIVRDQATMTRLGNIDQQFKGKYDAQLMMLAHTGQISKMPHLFSLENTMKLCPLIVEALWDQKNPLLQLPHIDEDILKYVNSKYHVKTLEQCVRLNEVLGNMSLVNIQTNVEVIDDEETNVIIVGALVTASVFLSRKSFSSLLNVEGNSMITIVLLNEPKVMKEEVKEIEDDIRNLDASISQDEDYENKEGAKDDEDWDKFQNPFNNRQKVLERNSRSSHSTILTAPFQVTNLVDKKEIMMAFTAPVTPELNKLTLCVWSDSYLGLDQFKDFTLDVKRAPEQPENHPQYDFSSDKDEKREAPEFEYATDTDDTAVIDDSNDSFTEDAEN
ncbi:hypothetical protein QYM36_013716 [Artemia franciscana]|uniref:Uncharacterized protein n=1 Tax=Artemia franciscana TaxID=6661 RepID=A0AA88HRB4_ARTSF|nr:hypothetical protein QYM36_013716 [Artemia franciscana]